MDMTHLKPGDEITRLLAGAIPVGMRVLRIEDDFIYCTLDELSSADELGRRLRLVGEQVVGDADEKLP